MAVTDFWKNLIKKILGSPGQEVSVQDLTDYIDSGAWNKLALYDLALHSGINIIAYALSMCEFRTFIGGKETKGPEYYTWNYEPNRNENASQFMQKLVWSLIYKNECLVVPGSNGDLLIADSYVHDRYAFYQDSFYNVTVCSEDSGSNSNPFTFQRRFRGEEVLFYKLSNKNITNLLTTLQAEYADLIDSAVTKFYKSGGERGTLQIDGQAPNKSYGVNEDGTPRTFNDVYRDLVNNQFKQYFKSPNAIMPLWSGFTYTSRGGEASKKSTSEVKDIQDLSDEIYDKVANALQIPPALLKGDIADVTALTKNLLTFAIDPIARLIERENNRKRNGMEVLNGTYQKIDTSRIMHIDAFDIADKADKMLASSIWSVDEIRRKAGDPEIGEEWSKAHARTKNYEDLPGSGSTVPQGGGEE